MKFFKKFLFELYNSISTLYENFFLKDKKLSGENNSSLLIKEGFEKIKLEEYSDIQFKDYELIKVNEYLYKYILSKEEINELIQKVFIKSKLAKLISKTTGFNYDIGFITAYITKHVPLDQQSEGWYANHWHRDKPFSKNMLKVIVPIKEITEKHGSMELINKKNSKNFSDKNISEINEVPFYKSTAKKNEILLFFPNLCLHKAGNPEVDLEREQIMFQLNPSKEWRFNKRVYEKQFYREPKFPFFSYFFSKKEKLNIF